MKIHNNVLSEYCLEEIKKELGVYLTHQKWGISSWTWDPSLTNIFDGVCLSSFTSETVNKIIENDIKNYLPKNYTEIVTQYYCWTKNSGINWHYDGEHNFGATIYMNEEWKLEYGGMFVWKDENGINMRMPEYNSMVVNDEKEEHMVTSISNKVPFDRLTIQIWGK
jgi:hypothetical protein